MHFADVVTHTRPIFLGQEVNKNIGARQPPENEARTKPNWLQERLGPSLWASRAKRSYIQWHSKTDHAIMILHDIPPYSILFHNIPFNDAPRQIMLL